ncbi:MAG TPA: Calx-beta domain-containing protein [Thermoanaerobaculia bacterium]|jgi:hypothetical protein
MQSRLTLVVLALIALPLSAATFTVTNTSDAGAGSLRQAILDANANAGLDTIAFSIGAGQQTIEPLSLLPIITDPANIDGTTQPGYAGVPLIEINGTSAGGFSYGIWLNAAGSRLEAVAVTAYLDAILVSTEAAVITNNYIGLRLDGSTVLSNVYGVHCSNECDEVAIFDNVISGNIGAGVLLNAPPSEVAVQGNYIGTDATGLLARANNVGVDVRSGSAILGGNLPVFGNVISGNTLSGVLVESGTTTVAFGSNLIGLGSDGTTPLGNGSHGIEILGDFARVGSTDAVNVIAYNGGNGVYIATNAANTGNPIRANRIFSNALLGIGFGGGVVIPNDNDDVDTGSANNLQNHPVLTSAIYSGGNVTITGTLNSTPSSTFGIDFFVNTVCDPSGFGEGQTYLGTATVNTDANGDAVINTMLAAPGGGFITATATNTTTSDTSQFSACRAVVNAAASNVMFSSPTYQVNEGAGFVAVTVNRSGSASGPATVQYTTSNGSATAGADYTVTAGMLMWADGDAAPKVFQVPILEDGAIEGNETFTVTLSNATGATLGPVSVATVTIVDNDGSAAAAPVPTASEWALLLLAGVLAVLALRRV